MKGCLMMCFMGERIPPFIYAACRITASTKNNFPKSIIMKFLSELQRPENPHRPYDRYRAAYNKIRLVAVAPVPRRLPLCAGALRKIVLAGAGNGGKVPLRRHKLRGRDHRGEKPDCGKPRSAVTQGVARGRE